MALFQDDTERRKAKIRAYIQNPLNSFEDRQEVWRKTPEHLATYDVWILSLPKFEKKYGEIDWYDDFYVERYTTPFLPDLLDIVVDKWTEDKKKDFIMECMDLGYHGFTMDW